MDGADDVWRKKIITTILNRDESNSTEITPQVFRRHKQTVAGQIHEALPAVIIMCFHITQSQNLVGSRNKAVDDMHILQHAVILCSCQAEAICTHKHWTKTFATHAKAWNAQETK
eukprot:scaffold314276_cov23-Prasinocladus_malaysianus.AAC.1